MSDPTIQPVSPPINHAAAFVAACKGKRYPNVAALDWASAIVSDLGKVLRGEIPEDWEDQDAAWTAYSEATKMIAELRAALCAYEATPPAESEAA